MTMLERMRRRFFERAAPIVLPRRIRLEVSSFCQLRCPSCPTTTGAIHPAVGSGFLKLEHFRRLLDLNPALERIEISNYGEVFLSPHLVGILEYAHRKGVAITIANGANLNHADDERLEALVKYGVRTLTISIDGASPDTYRAYRVRGDFTAVIANVERINHFKRTHGSERPHLVWQFVVFGRNEHEISIARGMAAELGMEFLTKLSWDDDVSPVRDHAAVRKETGGAATRREFEQIHGQKYARAICEQLWDDPQINWDGKVLGCCRNFWGDFGGNAFTEGLAASVNTERIAYARAMLSGHEPPRDDVPCTTCEMYHDMCARSAFMERGGRMTAFRVLLIVMWAVIFGYTAIVVAHHGMGLLPVFFGDMAAMGWPGQFNLDFMCMLALSALWVAWRHRFSGGGLGLAVLAFLGGASFLSIYLLVVSFQVKGDMQALLLGSGRTSR